NNNLLETIEKCKEMYNYRVENVKKIKQTIKYPVVLFTFFFVILILIKQYVLVPSTNFFFADSYSSNLVMYLIMCFGIFSFIFIILRYINLNQTIRITIIY